MTDNNPERWYHRCETPECCHYRRHRVIPRGDCSLCDHVANEAADMFEAERGEYTKDDRDDAKNDVENAVHDLLAAIPPSMKR